MLDAARIAPIGPARTGISLSLALARAGAQARKGGASKKAKAFGKSTKKPKLKPSTQPKQSVPGGKASASPRLSLAQYKTKAREMRKSAGPTRYQVAQATTMMIVRKQQRHFAQRERWRAEDDYWVERLTPRRPAS